MAQFFISHAKEDLAITVEVAQGLERAGYTTWYYERDSVPGPSYLDQVGRAIEEASAIVIVLSATSLESNHVNNEVVRAYESRLPFLPLLNGIAHVDLQRRQPTLRQALGASTTIQVPPDGIGSIIPRLVAGAEMLGIHAMARQSALAMHETPPRSSAVPEMPAYSRGDEAIVRALYVCFDRPAFRVHFEHETDLEALIAAVDDTIAAINTGVTKTRDGVVFGEPVKGKSYLQSDALVGKFDKIVCLLSEVKRRFSEAQRKGYFYPQRPGRLAFHHDHQAEAMGVAVRIDDLRNQVLTIANEVYSKLGLRPFPLIETPENYRSVAAAGSKQTRTDRAATAIKDHPVFSVLVVIALAAIALSQLTGAIENLTRFANERLGRHPATAVLTAEYCQLLSPLITQFDRTKSAFDRWNNQNLPLESEIIRDGNIKARNLLEQQAALVPVDLQNDRRKLVEHYDRWLEEFSRLREGPGRKLDEPFVFVGPEGFPFPTDSEIRFRARLESVLAQLGSRPNCGSF
jgi:hypothetical protein